MLRYKMVLALLAGCICTSLSAQELFVYAKPASNIPAQSVGLQLSNWLMNDDHTSRVNYLMVPEIMFGVNKLLMLHLEGYFSNASGNFSAEGAGLYAKYRFYSKDKVFYHFRMAAFARIATNNSVIHQEEIATNGYNTGYQLGLTGTQLLHKTAISATAYYEKALNNLGGSHEFPATFSANAINYSLSAGRLVLPRKYTGYKQTNLNLMMELLGQTLPDNGKQFIDMAGSVQFIFDSQTRVEIGYKYQLAGNMLRTAPNGFLIQVEYFLYNIL